MTNTVSELSAKNERRSKFCVWIAVCCLLLAGCVFVAFFVHVYRTGLNWPHRTSSPFNFVIDNYGWYYICTFVAALAGAAGFDRLYDYFAQVKIPDWTPLTVSETADGLPSIGWESKEGDRKADTAWKGHAVHNDFMRVRWHAFCSADGFLTITAQNFFHHRVFDDEKRKPGYLPLGDAPLNTKVRVPIDEVVGFSKRDSAHVELGGLDLVRFQKGQLLYMNHNIAVVEMRDKSSFLFGYSCYSAQDTDHLIVALTQEFIMKRPANGWAEMLKKKNDAANATPAVVTASATHDPI